MTGLNDSYSAVRLRPQLYLGAKSDDPAVARTLVNYVVADAIRELSAVNKLTIDVTLSSDTEFSVTDNGIGLPIEPLTPSRQSQAIEMLTTLVAGTNAPRGWGLVIPASFCTEVTVRTSGDGGTLAFRCFADNPVQIMPNAGTDLTGTELRFSINPRFVANAISPDLDSLRLDRVLDTAIVSSDVTINVVDHRREQSASYFKIASSG